MRSNSNTTLPTVADTHIPVGSLVTVTIGRNFADDPMTAMIASEWARFQTSITDLFHLLGGQTFGPFAGMGEWNGVVEDSAVITNVTSRPLDLDGFEIILRAIAAEFGQDAIAWSYGPARLATR